MAKKYSHISLNQARRKTLNVQKFGGLDLSSQKFNVASGRAIEAENWIKDVTIGDSYEFREGIIKIEEEERDEN